LAIGWLVIYFTLKRAVISLFSRVSSCFFAAEIQQNKTQVSITEVPVYKKNKKNKWGLLTGHFASLGL